MKPGVGSIIAGSVLLVLGVLVVPLIVILPLILSDRIEVQFKVPGTAEATIVEPGRYYLWNDFETVFEGNTYKRSKKIPDGYEIRIKDAKGELLEFVANASMTSSGAKGSKKSIGYVEVTEAGPLAIEVSGGDEERIFSFGPSLILKILGLVFGGVGAAMLFGAAGFVVIILGIVKLAKSSAKAPGATG
jgi:hypothetical protein